MQTLCDRRAMYVWVLCVFLCFVLLGTHVVCLRSDDAAGLKKKTQDYESVLYGSDEDDVRTSAIAIAIAIAVAVVVVVASVLWSRGYATFVLCDADDDTCARG